MASYYVFKNSINFNYIVSALLGLMLLVHFFHQEFTVHKLDLGPHPHLWRERDSSLDKETNI